VEVAIGSASATTDEDLVDRCRAGDVEAFSMVHSRHEKRLFRYAYLMTGSREDAHDLVQETFVRAFRALPGFRGECSAITWLTRICANLCRRHIRSARLRSAKLVLLAALVDRSVTREQRDPSACAERGFEQETVREALLRLPPRQREILLLREYDELSIDEIACVQSSTPGSVRVRLCRARRRLRDVALAMIEGRH
jgi:RNA polymerase sigma-70 factor (ECF subfamily)